MDKEKPKTQDPKPITHNHKYAEVVFNLPVDKSFHYLVPGHLEDAVEIGKRVKAPFGPRSLTGFIVGLPERPPKSFRSRLKEIIGVIDEKPLFGGTLLELARWMNEYYLCSLGETLGTFIPPRLGFYRYKEYKDSQAPIEASKPFCLSPSQGKVLTVIREAIKEGRYGSFLLHGITASGKTEVYLQAIDEVRRQGKGAIVLIPEISLTKQIVDRFSLRFPCEVAVLHSGLSAGERHREWRKIRDGQANIVIGARSAVFAPMATLGLIVVDEEHETSYKQDETSPRYHGRDVAIMRARIENALIILGSATPSLESFYNTGRGKSRCLRLKERIDNRPLPRVRIVDMKRNLTSTPGVWNGKAHGVLSLELRDELKGCLGRGEQAVLFLNRRGYSNFVLCRECGQVINCPDCDVSLTYHLKNKVLCCHYCNYTQSAPSYCPKCKGVNIGRLGMGTQRVEEEAKRLFPQARVLRMDRDTTRRRGSHEVILSAFEKGEADILLGTQMVAKGLDFAGVTLVGVISADVALNLPDFRAGERTFNLLTQVGGRAGRGAKEGLVIIQTYNPNYYSIVAAKDHDYDSFYEQEILLRKELGYPPFNHLLNIKIEGPDEKTVIHGAQDLGRGLKSRNVESGCQILGPAPCSIPKIRRRYRWQILIKGKQPSKIRSLVQNSLESVSFARSLKLIIDMDPMMML